MFTELLKVNKSFLKHLFLLGIVFYASTGYTATLQIFSNSSTVNVGDNLYVSVFVDSEGSTINNVDGSITFPNDIFDVLSISKSGSIFPLWVEEPSFSNSAGTITFDGGVPTPGFNGSRGQVVSFVLKAKKSGQADIVFADAAVRANDGLGTDVLSSKQNKSISVNLPSQQPVIKSDIKSETQSSIQHLAPPQITSQSHPNQDAWYSNPNPVISWTVPSGADAVQTSFSQNISDTPQTTYKPSISEKSIENVDDGTWYFKVRTRVSGTWSPVSTYVVNIDTVSPEKKSSQFSYDESSGLLKISADFFDVGSGIDHYDIYINDELVKTISAQELASKLYNLPINNVGNVAVKLLSYDRAGNHMEATGSFTVLEKKQFNFPKIPMVPIEVAVVTFVIATVGVIIFYEKKRLFNFNKSKQIRSALNQGNTVKTLSFMRKKLEKHLELLQKVRHERILTKEEKEIKSALESDLDEIDLLINKYKEN